MPIFSTGFPFFHWPKAPGTTYGVVRCLRTHDTNLSTVALRCSGCDTSRILGSSGGAEGTEYGSDVVPLDVPPFWIKRRKMHDSHVNHNYCAFAGGQVSDLAGSIVPTDREK